MDCENPILSAKITDHPITKPIGKCHYRHCDEVLYKGEGFEANGYLYHSTECIGEEGIEEGWVIDLSQQ
ncbi:hypothetical protein D1B33_18060 [Lysinibacillus yapensis]|uniref:Uncharacterized protein n=1 Tax=Ureibacillus yapensis TaxID=2304605 RepID=A0A396S929_9BACL|nr:hypothetical protein [Lysinibacillus yapensis]RHW31112.1 hypothetical protein D1B33_18060 [Lysinibacillus yapensis]